MGIRLTTPPSETQRDIDEYTRRVDRAIFRSLSAVGEQCINIARHKHPNDWTDQTGNLRSSIGYVVVLNGKVISMSDFQQVSDGAQGAQEGSAYARSLAVKHPVGWSLIVVAGMHYASYVAGKGRDVLDSAELKARPLAEKLLNQLKKQI